MPIITLTGYFRDDDGHGWSETHHKDGGAGSINLTTFVNAFDALMRGTRRALLAGDGYYIGCRASYPTADGTIASAPKIADLPVRGVQSVGGELVEMHSAQSAVKVRFQNATSTANSDVYIRGVWDDAIKAGQLNFGGVQGVAFKAALDAYTLQLITDIYGWVGVNPALTSRGNVTNYVTNVDGTITFTVAPTNGVVLPVTTERVQVIFSRINNSKSILNRPLVCRIVNPTTLTTVQVIAAGDFESNGTYTLPVKGFIAYDHLAYNKLASRKTGRPFGVGLGRLPARALS